MSWEILVAGFAGGMIRGLVGFIKYQYSYKNVGFNVPYFLVMAFLSGIIGLLTAAAFQYNIVFSFVIGYAGGDFVENVFKMATKSSSLYNIGDLVKKVIK
ncbi:MAG: hypothetical protein V1865_01030 [bacterium]